ncbi:lamina-associated polypeptide 2-like isoform X1 [Amphibalanus amphitrite]|uniref:lamina-associated polypeptide 2-like isoform X1 n=1 Tax=Amphibalanus amphitrite TaxID=1232801 RepID=UPI001C90D46F|nr:lamina-associated polypeptide 2-like isoform X1 [Amphibalanus amphitrite]
MASLTKSQLINELINHGVTPPSPSAKKDRLVQLYEKHVAPHQEAAGEFSSDDEGPAKQQNGDEGSVSSLATDVSELNNEELAEHLRSHGVNVGPIVGSTRRLYEKKLSKLLGETAVDGAAAERTTTTRYSTRTVTTVVNGSGSGGGDEYSDSEPELEPEPERRPEPEPELRKRRTVDAAPRGYSYKYRSSRAEASSSSSSARAPPSEPRGPAVRAVFLRDNGDQPSPRRGVRDVRGSYPQEQYLITKTDAASSYAGADLTDSRAAPALPRKEAPGSGGWLRALVKLSVLLILIAAAYYCYQHYNEAPSFVELQKAARDAVRRAAEKVDGLRQAAAGAAAGEQTTQT